MVTHLAPLAYERLSARAKALEGETLDELAPICVLAPHPDDETLGCGGLLAAEARRGAACSVVFLTDGSASHRGSPTWPKPRIASERRREALGALAALGVQPSHALFLDWPDAAPPPVGHPAFDRALERLTQWCVSQGSRSLFAPWGQEEHCDHQAAAALADLAAARLKLRRLDFLVWGWTSSLLLELDPAATVWRLACGDLAPVRRRALASHRTQMTDLIADAQEAFLIDPSLAALVEQEQEIFLERTLEE